MDSYKPSKTSLSIARAAVACLWFCAALAAVAESSLAEDQHRFKALESISYGFGSKFTSGFFVAQSGACLLTLMVIEKSQPDEPLPFTAVRLRLTLKPGQMAGLDSEEGRSLNFTCGEGATTLLVNAGEGDKLAAAQTNSAHE
jgi:hypothetical protein